MKKLFLGILILLLCLLGYIYFIIPNKLSFQENISINANSKGLHRNLTENINWIKWWPGSIVDNSTNQTLEYKTFNYYFGDKLVSSFIISIMGHNIIMRTSMDIIPANLDSTTINWKGEVETVWNPLFRIQQYFYFKKLKKQVKELLINMQSHYSQTGNVYGINIYRTTVKDSILVSTFAVSKDYPSTSFIYGLIDEIKKYAKANGASETGAPMLNIYTKDSTEYTVRVAIPVNKKLPTSGNISYKWMLGGGNILLAEVKGGANTANNAMKQVEHYITDYELIPPAIPFQSLNTNRMEEADTNKWVTTIYYPVMWYKSNP